MRSFVVEESSNSVKVFWLEQEELLEEIRGVAKLVGEADSNVLKSVLFGSLAEKKGFARERRGHLGHT